MDIDLKGIRIDFEQMKHRRTQEICVRFRKYLFSVTNISNHDIQEDVFHLFDLGRVSGNFTNYVSVSVTPTGLHVLTCISATITSHHSRSKTVLKLSLPVATLSLTSCHHYHHHLILPGATLSPTHLRKLNSSKPWLALRLSVIQTEF